MTTPNLSFPHLPIIFSLPSNIHVIKSAQNRTRPDLFTEAGWCSNTEVGSLPYVFISVFWIDKALSESENQWPLHHNLSNNSCKH
uniref:Uncharacterized protein n=1 Tax=Arundo donax TaxID=35708 RepID=A0A0A9FW67_ARUDO